MPHETRKNERRGEEREELHGVEDARGEKEASPEEAATEVSRQRDEYVQQAKKTTETFTEETADQMAVIETSADAPMLPEERSVFNLLKETAVENERAFESQTEKIIGSGTEAGAERKEHEPVRQTFEYRDSEGRILGTAEIGLEREEVDVDEMAVGKKEKGRGRVLKSFVLRGEKDGQPTEVDVMAMINPHNAEIIVASGRLDDYSYDDVKNRATVPMPETPLDIGVLMHELGHADQHHEERFAPVSPLYELGKSAFAEAETTVSDMRKKIETVVAAVPEAKTMIDDETIREISAMEAEKFRLTEKRDSIKSSLSERKAERGVVEQKMLSRAVLEALPEGFSEEVRRTFDELSGNWDAKESTAKTAEFIGILEKAGFRFAEKTPEPEPETKKVARRFSMNRGDVPEIKDTTPLPKDKITGVDMVLEVAGRFENVVDTEKAKVAYSKDRQTIKTEVSFPQGSPFWKYRLDFEVPLSEKEHDAYVADRDTADAAVAAVEKELADTRDALDVAARDQKERMERSNLRDIIRLPMRMLERDATRRAYQWMRKVREDAGVDLFAAHMARRESTLPGIRETGKDGEENCASSTGAAFEPEKEEWVKTDVRTGLSEGLKSYGAKHPPLKKRGS